MAVTLDITSASGWGFSTHDLILQARRKLPRNQVDRIALLGGLTKKEMARILGVTERNLYNQHQGDLSVPLSERLLLLEKLFQHGLAVFDGKREAFFQWLRTPLAELATPEVGFAAPTTLYNPRPIQEMGTKEVPPDLTKASRRPAHAPAAATGYGRSTLNFSHSFVPAGHNHRLQAGRQCFHSHRGGRVQLDETLPNS